VTAITRIVRLAQPVAALERAAAFSERLLESPPSVRFDAVGPRCGHEDDRLGPAGSAEWHALVRDGEGDVAGPVEQRPGATPPAPA
jgi:hypothetical protein